MKSRPDVFKEANIESVLIRLRTFALKYSSYDQFMVELIKNIDVEGRGFIDFNELVVGLKRVGFNLTYQEIYLLMRYFNLD